ncbi:MAG TPA: ATP-dependent Clp protease proteolytic subunit [Verrucomicrobiota bacterium]|nr:ATP-dependent Clp protease proteolytic subunit [Verrucomicrobiota bacterium]
MNPLRYIATLLGVVASQGCSVLITPGTEPAQTVQTDFSDPVLNQRRILVVGNITDTAAAETIRQLFFLDAQNSQPIDLYLMTPGGDLKAAFAIEHAFQLTRSPINTHALGECNSSGAVLLAAGTGHRQAFHDSTIVIHGMVVKNDPPVRYVELTQESYTAFWRRHAKLPESWLPVPPGKTFVLSAQQALDYGVIDSIIARPEPVPGAKPNR